MCRVCTEYQLGRLTAKEALRNAGEMAEATESGEERDHLHRVMEAVADEEIKRNHEKAIDDWWSDGGSTHV